MSTPILTQEFLRDRGFQTDIVICPACQSKWEVLRSDRADARHCDAFRSIVPPVDFTTWDKTRRMTEIDLMPLFVFRNYLKLLIDEIILRHRSLPNTLNFLCTCASHLEQALGKQWQGEFIMKPPCDFFPGAKK